MSLLFISIAALLAGPLLVAVWGRRAAIQGPLQAYVAVTVGGLVVLHLLPSAVRAAGWLAVASAGLGFVGPLLLERRLTGEAAGRVYAGSALVALLGLTAHALVDGAALSMPTSTAGHVHHHDGATLAAAVILHRLPTGLLVALAGSAVAGQRAVIAVLAAMTAATIAGFVASDVVLQWMSPRGVSLFVAFVGGMVLHVVAHVDRTTLRASPRGTALGASAGVATLAPLLIL